MEEKRAKLCKIRLNVRNKKYYPKKTFYSVATSS